MPSVSFTGVTTSRMSAPGANTCAHSTSSVVSWAQKTMSPSVGSNGGGAPAGVMIVSFGSCAIAGSGGMPGLGEVPNTWSKWCRSAAIVGEPNGSTIAIVVPVPSMPAACSPARL